MPLVRIREGGQPARAVLPRPNVDLYAILFIVQLAVIRKLYLTTVYFVT